MAKKPNYVWGIDIGQCGLKALRCLEEDGQIVADAFDYIEYPKILSQPEADPEARTADRAGSERARRGSGGLDKELHALERLAYAHA